MLGDAIRVVWGTIEGCFFYLLHPKKTVVFIASAQRSGSTLLKALLAEAPDVSHLPEIPPTRYPSNRFSFYGRVCRLSPKQIIILKYPAPLYSQDYPPYYLDDMKYVILFRTPCCVVQSLMKIREFPWSQHPPHWNKDDYFDYWIRTYEALLCKLPLDRKSTCFVSYENLTENPRDLTRRLFSFIGSVHQEGVESYTPPSTFSWTWGSDDVGDKINSLRVQRAGTHQGCEFLACRENRIRIEALLEKLSALSLRG